MQRCHWCAPLRDEEVIRKRKAGEGKGSESLDDRQKEKKGNESSGEMPIGRVEFILGVFRKEIDDLRARVMELEAARMFS